jgi:hypothetical protein
MTVPGSSPPEKTYPLQVLTGWKLTNLLVLEVE